MTLLESSRFHLERSSSCPKTSVRILHCTPSKIPEERRSYFHPAGRPKSSTNFVTLFAGGFGGLGVSVLASGTQVRGFKPGRSRRIFKGGKILTPPSFGREVKPSVPCRRFAACKRSLNVPWKSAFKQDYRSLSPAHKFQLPPLECGTRR
jgi:hypothetical protein